MRAEHANAVIVNIDSAHLHNLNGNLYMHIYQHTHTYARACAITYKYIARTERNTKNVHKCFMAYNSLSTWAVSEMPSRPVREHHTFCLIVLSAGLMLLLSLFLFGSSVSDESWLWHRGAGGDVVAVFVTSCVTLCRIVVLLWLMVFTLKSRWNRKRSW